MQEEAERKKRAKEQEEFWKRAKEEQEFWKRYRSYKNNNSYNKNNNNRNKDTKVQNYLKVLGLAGNVTDWSIIKINYRKLCKKYHTDVNKSANALEMMQNINEAYSELEKIYG